ncbi:SDR family NAD(P)-dependent oxidoreductase [Oceanicaulis sp. LC35]|uniref:SDR family NAD(P)-dependent oxidoreductase n=1 Tax=Oceanicaulis sp. LC35 TaxID=3349635 RepID=UPI003F846564
MSIALVTGGSRGLGRDMALKLAQSGHDVLLTYVSNTKAAEDVVAEIMAMGQRAHALRLDVAKAESFPAFFETVRAALHSQFGAERFDYLINNAGVGLNKPFQETTLEEFDTMLNVHLRSAFFLTQGALELLNNGGGVVNISSGLTRFSFPGYDAYATMKGGVEVLTRYMAQALGSRGIRVNVLAPGAIETDFNGGVVRDTPQMNSAIAEHTALGRVGLPEDIGGVVAFLCSDAARWITGVRIEASGGMLL